jgi:serine/threonine protein kinase
MQDEQLAQVLDDIAQKRIGADSACQEHPQWADEIRRLCALGQLLDFCGRTDSQNTLAARTSAAADHSLPRTFAGYELVEELGRGGMGIVYKARDPELQRDVALKMVLRGSLASEADLARFRSEAQAAAGLNHPQIVPIYQVGEHEGQPYFCMKYVPGRTLAEVIAEGPLPPRQAAAYLAGIARAVQHAHDKGVLHRDLKPSNVLLQTVDPPSSHNAVGQSALWNRQSAVPLLTDFGLAKRVEGGASLTGTGAILGTPTYMAPEQAAGDGKPVGPAADVYSLGAILYEMLTGRPPFLAASIMETLLLVRSEEPVRPRLLNPQIDVELELICRKCLEKRPEHRYGTAAQLADDLEAFLRGEPVSARSSSLVYFVSRIFRDTHHAPIQENWGLLWILHSAQILVLCGVTSALYAAGLRSHEAYLLLWSIGLVAWGAFFWQLRKRGGPVSFVERQIAHAWGAGVAASIALFIVEVLLGLEVLYLTPVLPIIAGMVFIVMAGTLGGWFYIAAGLSIAAVVPMAALGSPLAPLLFGVISGLGFFVPGVKYYRQRRSTERVRGQATPPAI